MLIFYAGKYVNAITAEDLVQDVFLKVWQKKTFLFLKEGIKTYGNYILLYTIYTKIKARHQSTIRYLAFVLYD